MNNITKLLILFWLSFPLIVRATEREIILSSSQMYNYQAHNGGVRDLYNKIGTDDPEVDKDFRIFTDKKSGENLPLRPYKSPFTCENFKHIVAVGASLGIGEIAFEFGIKPLLEMPHITYNLKPLIITGNILFELFCATGGFYAYKKWFKTTQDLD